MRRHALVLFLIAAVWMFGAQPASAQQPPSRPPQQDQATPPIDTCGVCQERAERLERMRERLDEVREEANVETLRGFLENSRRAEDRKDDDIESWVRQIAEAERDLAACGTKCAAGEDPGGTGTATGVGRAEYRQEEIETLKENAATAAQRQTFDAQSSALNAAHEAAVKQEQAKGRELESLHSRRRDCSNKCMLSTPKKTSGIFKSPLPYIAAGVHTAAAVAADHRAAAANNDAGHTQVLFGAGESSDRCVDVVHLRHRSNRSPRIRRHVCHCRQRPGGASESERHWHVQLEWASSFPIRDRPVRSIYADPHHEQPGFHTNCHGDRDCEFNELQLPHGTVVVR